MQVITTSEYHASFDTTEEAITFMQSLLERYTDKQMLNLTVVPRRVMRLVPVREGQFGIKEQVTVWDTTVVFKKSEIDSFTGLPLPLEA